MLGERIGNQYKRAEVVGRKMLSCKGRQAADACASHKLLVSKRRISRLDYNENRGISVGRWPRLLFLIWTERVMLTAMRRSWRKMKKEKRRTKRRALDCVCKRINERIDYVLPLSLSCAGCCDNLTCGSNNTTLHGEGRSG